MAGFVQSLGLQLRDRGGQPFDAHQLTSGDVIAFYFSAHWCPPCRHFTPMLKTFFETLRSHGESSLKIIFVSTDKTEHEMWKYIYDSHGDWLALAFSDSAGKERLNRQYQVSGIPALVVIDAVGNSASKDARGEVMGAVSSSSTAMLTTYLGWKSRAGAVGDVSVPRPPVPMQASCNELPPQTRVRLRNLVSTPELNGSEGVVRAFDAGRQRYTVELGDRSLALRFGNLLQLMPVRLFGDAAASDGWLEAEVIDFDEASGLYVLRREGDDAFNADPSRARSAISVAPGGLVLKPGARVLVGGLQAESAKQWNDKLGEVVEFDLVAGRYVVQVSPATSIKIRPENVRL